MRFLFLGLMLFSTVTRGETPDSKVFSFHLFSEPVQLNPQYSTNVSGTYLLTNLFRGLFRYTRQAGLIPEMAKKCERRNSSLVCQLRVAAKWSDGQAVEVKDFLRSFRFLIDPANIGNPIFFD